MGGPEVNDGDAWSAEFDAVLEVAFPARGEHGAVKALRDAGFPCTAADVRDRVRALRRSGRNIRKHTPSARCERPPKLPAGPNAPTLGTPPDRSDGGWETIERIERNPDDSPAQRAEWCENAARARLAALRRERTDGAPLRRVLDARSGDWLIQRLR